MNWLTPTHPHLPASPTVSHNGAPEKKYVGAYQTDFLADRAEEFIGDGAASGQPFYVHISTTAPHQLGNKGAPIPAKRHSRLYPDAKVPRLANWNELDVSDKSSHVQSLPILLPEDEAKIEGQYRARLQSLRAVDEMLDRIGMPAHAARPSVPKCASWGYDEGG